MAVGDLPIDRRALLTQADAATYCGTSEDVMRVWMREPGFPAIVKAPLTQPRVVRLALDAWLAEQPRYADTLATTATECTQCGRTLDATGSCPDHPATRQLEERAA